MRSGIADGGTGRAIVATLCAASFAVMLASPGGLARALDDVFDADDIETLFSIRKNANRNRVDYGLRLDTGCRPVGDAPVVPYWRMLEEGERVREPLLAREQRAYGIASQEVTVSAEGGRIDLHLRALPDRTVVVNVRRTGARCVARSITSIGGVQAALEGIFVALRSAVMIEYVELSGRTTTDGTPVTERMSR